jgi:serine/threonine-protein kinase
MEPKTYLNRYRMITGQSGLPVRVIGGAGERTYKAEEVTTKQAVALELVPAGGLHPEVLVQLEAEAQAAKQLNHINIPKLYDYGVEDDHLVYASELFDGTTAEAWVTAHGPMPVGATLRIAQQVVGALGAATFHGILHHAINPRNVMIVPGQTSDGEWPLIKVLNFVGIAPDVSAAEAGALGAAHFASPEQLAGADVDFRSEIYSLGRTLAFLLTGSAAAGRQGIEGASGVPGSVKQLIADMTMTDPSGRPLDPLAFQRRIQDLLAQVDRRDNVATKFGLGPAAAKVMTQSPTPRPFPTKPLVLAALVLALATCAAFGVAALQPGGLFSGGDDSIGVPVGIPEPTTTRTEPATIAQTQADRTAPAASAAPSTDLAADEPTNAIASNPPVLTSDPAPSPQTNDTAPATEAPAEVQRAPQVASNQTPASETTLAPAPAPVTQGPASREQAPAVASNKTSGRSAALPPEPLPPSEGPDEAQPETAAAIPSNDAVSYAQQSMPTIDNSGASERTTASNSVSPSTATAPKAVREKSAPVRVAASPTPRPKQTTTIATAPKRSKKSEQFASNTQSMPPIPRGAVRAEFLGTTADGNLVFGLPSQQRGYIQPGESRRRSRRNAPPPDMEVLPALPPVLPALPPDDE